MERNGDIASLFQKHAAKKNVAAAAATSNPDPIEPVVEEQIHERVVEEIVNPMPPPQPSSLPRVYDTNRLLHDPGERHPILKYPVNDQDAIRRAYIIKGPFKPFAHDFLLHQGLAFRGHDESEESSNRGNFIELLKFLAGNSEEVKKYVLDNALGNCTLTSSDI